MEWLRARSSRQEFERFVTNRSGSLLQTAYLMAGNLAEAEDLVQETLLRVARHWPKVRAMEYPAAYARRVLVNVALDGAERRARRAGELAASDGDAADPADTRAQRELYGVAPGAGGARTHDRQLMSPLLCSLILLELVSCNASTCRELPFCPAARIRVALPVPGCAGPASADDRQPHGR